MTPAPTTTAAHGDDRRPDRHGDDRRRRDRGRAQRRVGGEHARLHRPRLGTRDRHEPVGRLRLRAARLELPRRSSRTTTPARRSNSRPSIRRARPAGRARPKIALESALAVAVARRAAARRSRCPPASSRSPATLAVAGKKLVPPLTFTPGHDAARRRREAVPRHRRRHPGRTKLQVVNTLTLEQYVDARRRLRDAVDAGRPRRSRRRRSRPARTRSRASARRHRGASVRRLLATRAARSTAGSQPRRPPRTPP